MKTSLIIPIILLSGASLGLSTSALASHSNTSDPFTAIGHGTVTVVKGIGNASVQVVSGFGRAAGQVLTGVGNGFRTVGTSTVNAVEGRKTHHQ